MPLLDCDRQLWNGMHTSSTELVTTKKIGYKWSNGTVYVVVVTGDSVGLVLFGWSTPYMR